MFKDHKSTTRTLALFVFLVALILYVRTMAPTASFWDPGEFIAVAHSLEVNHPPGAPFFSLLGRIFSMFIPTAYVAASVNFISSVASALTIMLLFLIVVRLVREWQYDLDPDTMSPSENIGMFGGAMIGAFTFAVTDSFWFNAVEAEVYALSMFFTALVIWMALKWSEHHEEENSERWLVLISYMFGLALGVHLLNLLAIFFVALIVYFKKKEVTLLSLVGVGIIAVVSFLAIYPFTVQMLPGILDDITIDSYGLIGPIFFFIIILGGISYGIYYTHVHHHRIANLALVSYTMILIGYSSYALIFIRSMANPPIDENNPENISDFISYLKREQYGETPLFSGHDYDNATGQIDQDKQVLFPRRWDGSHDRQYAQYSSDWDYFLNYQLDHMYIRYFNWNFIGRDSDIQDASWQAGFGSSRHTDNPAHNSYYYIPLLIGLFGMIFHFQKDWKRALAVFVLFIMTGFAIIVFLNQTPLQPRERDYAYVGSFFAFALWIGMGGVGIVELVRDLTSENKFISMGVVGLLFLGCPFLMGYQNFNDHDRHNRYVAPDYAWNLLQSVSPNAILFTNGDNDTFPLWYLQEVEGVRTDVRIVCLSLLNTPWYIKQLKNEWSHESAPLPISLSDDEITNIAPHLYQPDTIRIPVDKEMLKTTFSSERDYKNAIGVNPDTTVQLPMNGVDFGIPVDSLDNEVSWYFQGRVAGRGADGTTRYYTEVQDDLILDILKTNQWKRPVYFANTVSSGSQLGLQPYFRYEGMAFRVVPQRHNTSAAGGYGWMNTNLFVNRIKKFRFRDWNNPHVYLDENIRRMLSNYRYGITQLADNFRKQDMPDSAAKWLAWGEEKLPFIRVQNDYNSMVLYAYSYAQNGALDNAMKLAKTGVEKVVSDLSYNMDQYDQLQNEIMDLNSEAQSARENANISKQRRLQSQMQGINSQRQNIAQDIGIAISHLTLLQRIYYMAGDDDQAKALADRVNGITKNRISIPTSKEDNLKQIEQYGLD